MKKLKHLLPLFTFLCFTACSITVDVDDEDELARITASAKGDNPNGTVSENGYLDVTILGFDRDGIASVRIEIPALNVDFLTAVNTYQSTQRIEQTFKVGQINQTEAKTIFVTLKDVDGNSYTETLAFATE